MNRSEELVMKVDFIDNQRQKKHANLTRKVTKKQAADKSRLKTNSTKVMMF